MEIIWQDQAWEDYLYWQLADKKILQRINDLVKDCKRNHCKGIGKPEPLKGDFSGCWSRRIRDVHRLVYLIKENRIHIIQCRYHYN